MNDSASSEAPQIAVHADRRHLAGGEIGARPVLVRARRKAECRKSEQRERGRTAADRGKDRKLGNADNTLSFLRDRMSIGKGKSVSQCSSRGSADLQQKNSAPTNHNLTNMYMSKV